MGAQCVSSQQANDFLSKDANRITGRIARSLAINAPWMNVIETGTFVSGVSDVQRSVVQEAVAPALSQATPNWSSFSCTRVPAEINTGTTEFQYTPEAYFERGPKICVTQAFSSFRNSIRMTEMAITDHVQTLWNSWIRFKLFQLSGTKVTLNSTATSLDDILASGFQTNFKTGIGPNAPVSFKFLKFLANHLTHSLLAGDEFKWGAGMTKHFRFISDQATVDAMRAEADVRSDIRFIASSGNADARNALMEYSWEGPYQGIGFGVDQSILRVSSFNTTTGVATFVEPFIQQAATKGNKRVVNPSWIAAPFQVSFLLARGSFIREIPEEFLGEGLTKFERQFWGGRVVWHNVRDNDCNIKGDTGFHYYDLAAAMRPERPEFVVPILHTRCRDDLGLTACTPQGYYSQSF